MPQSCIAFQNSINALASVKNASKKKSNKKKKHAAPKLQRDTKNTTGTEHKGVAKRSGHRRGQFAWAHVSTHSSGRVIEMHGPVRDRHRGRRACAAGGQKNEHERRDRCLCTQLVVFEAPGIVIVSLTVADFTVSVTTSGAEAVTVPACCATWQRRPV